MAPTKPTEPPHKPTKSTKSTKLPKLPKNTRIEKRPLLHPAIPSPHTNASHPKTIYISKKTPFISAVKRVRSLLTHIEKRSTPIVDLINGKGSDKQKLNALAAKMKKEGKEKGGGEEPEPVILKGTNRAIEKVCELALFFQGQDDVQVRVKTGSVGTVDDIVENEDAVTVKSESEEGKDDGEELPESRVRWLSVVEAHISLK